MYYNELVVPLLNRMSNLEKLSLDLTIIEIERFINGNDLKENILNRMPQLNQFTFSICSVISINDQMNFLSQEDIQETFKDFQYMKIISRLDYFLKENQGQCHVYSHPFIMQHYENITNNFPDGLYPYVRVISLYDEHPFEHEFFLQISQSFPFMRQLSLSNRYAQKNKQSYKSMNDDDQNLLIVTYCYLTELYLEPAHDDYIEEFLCNTKTCLQNDIILQVDFKSLERVTYGFTRDDTRINCSKINKMYLHGIVKYDCKSVQDYFPFAKII
jgi:hypothetical protein